MTQLEQITRDYDSALAAAELCLFNLTLIQECHFRPVRECAYRVAMRQYMAVRRFARELNTWAKSLGFEPTPDVAMAANELRNNLHLVRAEFRGTT